MKKTIESLRGALVIAIAYAAITLPWMLVSQHALHIMQAIVASILVIVIVALGISKGYRQAKVDDDVARITRIMANARDIKVSKDTIEVFLGRVGRGDKDADNSS